MFRVMNRVLGFAIIIHLMACHSPREKPANMPAAIVPADAKEQIRYIDLERSSIKWTGTKLLGAGSHTGTLQVKSGFLSFHGNDLSGGHVIADMASLFITDIPLSDPVPRKNLTRHLNQDLEISEYPEAVFKFNSVSRNGNNYQLTGALTIKGVTNEISVEANYIAESDLFITDFNIDRFRWGIGENGSWLERKLVDAGVAISVTLKVIR